MVSRVTGTRVRPRLVRTAYSVGAFWDDTHLLAFPIGGVLRRRRNGGWKHYRLDLFAMKPHHVGPGGMHKGVIRLFEVSTWRSSPGPKDRILGTKRYFRIQCCPRERRVES